MYYLKDLVTKVYYNIKRCVFLLMKFKTRGLHYVKSNGQPRAKRNVEKLRNFYFRNYLLFRNFRCKQRMAASI